MLTDVLRAMVNNPIKESFYGKKKKQLIFWLSISRKSDVKTFLKWIVNHCLKAPDSMTHIYIYIYIYFFLKENNLFRLF